MKLSARIFAAAVSLAFLSAYSFSFRQDQPSSVIIDDFENGPKNCLGGISGPWAADESNPNIFTKVKTVEIKGPGEKSRKSLKMIYSVDSDKDAFTGWWTKLGGFDARGYDALEFYVMGDKKDGFTAQFSVEIKSPKAGAEKTETLTGKYKVKKVTDRWQKVSLPLYSFSGLFDKTNQDVWKDPKSALKDLAEITIVFSRRGVTARTGTLYFDDFRFVRTGAKYTTVFDSPERKVRNKGQVSFGSKTAVRKLLAPAQGRPGEFEELKAQLDTPEKAAKALKEHPGARIAVNDDGVEYWMHLDENGLADFYDGASFRKYLTTRLNGFPVKTVVRKELPDYDTDLLRMIARDTWAYFDEIVDREHGLPLDTLALDKDDPNGNGTSLGDYTNITNIGVYLGCLVAASDLGFITKDEAARRARVTLETVSRLQAHKSGFLYNYYDTTTLERTEYFVSSVDSGWLAAGVYLAKNAFPELSGICSKLLKRWNFSFFYDPVEQQLYHGFIENIDNYSDYHYGCFYTEPRLTSYIAIARGDIPEEHWFGMVRTFPANYDWTTQQPKGRREKSFKGISYRGGWYEYGAYRFVPSWGGSMFEALMPTLLIDEKTLAPKGLGLNDETHVRATIDYTLNFLKYPVWGMSPSSDPKGGYSEFGVKALGCKGYPPGAVTPHASFLALEFAPREAILNIRKMLKGWDCYGEYGFYDAIDPRSRAVAYKYLALDQGMILLAIDNYINNGSLRNCFQKDPVFSKGAELLSAESFFE